MRAKTILTILSGWMLLSLAGCDPADPIYNTPHPDSGKITLNLDWSQIGEGYPIPENYTVRVGDYTATLSGGASTIDNLFAPGTYDALTYHNGTEALEVDGTKARMKNNVPMSGNLFSCAMKIGIEKDTDHTYTAVMRQQMRLLTLIIEPAGGTTDKIENISGELTNVAGELDLVGETYGSPAAYGFRFTKITEGSDAGKWSATFPLLGFVPDVQKSLSVTISFAADTFQPIKLNSDLTAALSGFNDDKLTPLTLGGTVIETPTGAGFTASITDWVDNSTEVDAR